MESQSEVKVRVLNGRLWEGRPWVTSVGRSDRIRTVHLLEAIWKVKLITPLTFSSASSHKPRWSFNTKEAVLVTFPLSSKPVCARGSAHPAVETLDMQRYRFGLLVGGVQEKLGFCFLPPLRCGQHRVSRCVQDVKNLLCQSCDVNREALPKMKQMQCTAQPRYRNLLLKLKNKPTLLHFPSWPSCPVHSSWWGRLGATRPSSAKPDDV